VEAKTADIFLVQLELVFISFLGFIGRVAQIKIKYF